MGHTPCLFGQDYESKGVVSVEFASQDRPSTEAYRNQSSFLTPSPRRQFFAVSWVVHSLIDYFLRRWDFHLVSNSCNKFGWILGCLIDLKMALAKVHSRRRTHESTCDIFDIAVQHRFRHVAVNYKDEETIGAIRKCWRGNL